MVGGPSGLPILIGAYMIKSEQGMKLGEQGFIELKEEIAAASAESLRDFQTAVHPDGMGFYGKEGVEDEDNQ